MATKSVAKKVRVLTEPDLLKASDKEYMSEEQLAFFRQRLLELRAQLLNNADDTGQHLRENEVTTDPSDRATLEEEYTLELRTRDRERKLLKKIEKSLKMIDDGSLRLLRGDRRADRHPAPSGAADGDAVARGAGAPRARAEALRRLSVQRRRRRRRAVRRAAATGRTLGRCVPATAAGKFYKPKIARCDHPPAMKNSSGIDSAVLVRDARKATRRALAFSSSVAGFSAEDLLLIRPDQRPHVEQHDGAEPRADADAGHAVAQRERVAELIAEQRGAGKPGHDRRPAEEQQRARRDVLG